MESLGQQVVRAAAVHLPKVSTLTLFDAPKLSKGKYLDSLGSMGLGNFAQLDLLVVRLYL